MLLDSALEYAIRRIQVNLNGLKLNCTHQHKVYADDVNIMGGSIYCIFSNQICTLYTVSEG
jgi:hypothetical protein